MDKEFNIRIKNKVDTAENWNNSSLILYEGETAYEKTIDGKLRKKIGDGVNAWSALPYSDESVSIDFVLLAGEWTSDPSSNSSSQTVIVDGIKSDSNGIIGVADSATKEQYQQATFAMLRKTNQSDGNITIVAYGEEPTIDIPVTVILI